MSTRWDSSWPAFVAEPRRQEILGYFQVRFGIRVSVFADYHLLERHKVYVLARQSEHLQQLASLKVHTVGLTVLRKIRNHLKPTTAVLQRFGHLATRNTLELDDDQLAHLLQSRELAMDIDLQPGYVILLTAGHILGCGLYTPGRLRSQIPRRLNPEQPDDEYIARKVQP